MAKINSRQKGAAGEREARDFWRDRGHPANRGRQYSGSPDSPDIVVHSLPAFHFEVKRVQQLNLEDALAQATRDAGDKIPLVMHRRNGGEWMITMSADMFAKAFAPLYTKGNVNILDILDGEE
jgi:Holliday junction resolvase